MYSAPASRNLTLGSLALWCATISAQSAQAPAPADVADVRVPLHAAADGTLWAAGPDYKVAFGDGFTFYPVLGAARPANLPLRWRTDSIALGGAELAGAADTAHTDWRYERRYGAVVEAYDVRADGVEQTFVLARHAGAGDLVVRGRIATPLQAVALEGAVAPVTFRAADGEEIVRYGSALAFDAAGRRLPVPTVFDGETVTLRVDGSWLAGATYPVTLDPLTSNVSPSSSGGRIGQIDVARNDETDELVYTFSRASSATDYDLWARVTPDGSPGGYNVLTEIDARYSCRRAQAAFIGGPNRWAISYERTFSDTSAIFVYLHDRGNQTANSGRFVLIPPPSGMSDEDPSIGGTPGNDSGTRAFVVFRRDRTSPPANTASSTVQGSLIDCVAGTVVKTTQLAGGTGLDAESPSVNRMNAGGPSSAWLAVWQQRTSTSAWGVRVTRIAADGTPAAVQSIGSTASNTIHNLDPMIAGAEGRYLVAWTARPNTGPTASTYGDTLRVQRIDWADQGGSIVRYSGKTLVSRSRTVLTLGEGRAIAYDRNTDSHWAIGYRESGVGVTALRVGYDGSVVEQAPLQADTATSVVLDPSVCYDDDHYRFAFAYRVDGSLHQVRAVGLEYPTGAKVVAHGGGCKGFAVATNRGGRDLPYAGSQFFAIDLASGHPNASYVLFAGVGLGSPLTLPLSSGCTFELDTKRVLIDVRTGTTDAGGRAGFPLPLRANAIGFDLFWQYVQLGGFGISASTAIETAIR